jgi:hypothetical protein
MSKISNKARKKMSESHKGLKHSAETKKKIGEYHAGSKSHFWKGGVDKKNLPLYDTYADRLSYVVDVRNKESLLEVRCHFCGKWFVPKRYNVIDRIRALEGKKGGECNLYCSKNCKKNCATYAKNGILNYNKTKFYNTGEYKIWRKEVLLRAKGVCEYCDSPATDAHHIIPRSKCKLFELDPDYGLACCEKCHYKYGHSDKCAISNLTK